MGTHGRQGESWVPKARTTGMRREVKKALGKDHRDKEGKKGKRRKTILSLPNAGDLERSTVVEREYGDKLETRRKVSRVTCGRDRG